MRETKVRNSFFPRSSFWRQNPIQAMTGEPTWKLKKFLLQVDKINALHVEIASFRNQFSVFVHE